MTGLRRVSVTAVLCVLTFATMADAECAWVLWTWSAWDERSGKSWDSEGVWKSQEDCLRQLDVHKGAAEVAKKEGRGTFIEHPSMLTVVYDVPKGEKAGRIWGNKFEFRCLPDTVDPRGLKGK